MHPAFVLICGSKYLQVLKAGSQLCSWHGGIAGWQGCLCRALTEREGLGAGEADSPCSGVQAQEDSLSQCPFPLHPQGSWILKLQDPEEEAYGEFCLIPGLFAYLFLGCL